MSGSHIQATFRCVVKQSPVEPQKQDNVNARVHSCWVNPAAPPALCSGCDDAPVRNRMTHAVKRVDVFAHDVINSPRNTMQLKISLVTLSVYRSSACPGDGATSFT